MRKKIAVLFGGCSPEYSVSLQSAYAVLTHMDRNQYEPVPVGISPKGEWFLYTGDLDRIPEDRWLQEDACVPVTAALGGGSALLLLGENGAETFRIDAAFPVLHGRNGEDGTVQGLLALAGIPVVGCGVLASALCMDKDRAHRLVRDAGVEVPRSFVFRMGEEDEAIRQAEELGFPLFVKPVGAGSSYGITRVEKRDQLPNAVRLAFQYDCQILVEACIPGFEVGCAVMGNQVLTVGEPDEIELSQGFFDFNEKYTLQTSAIHVPARITAEETRRIKETAQTVYRVLGCSGFARVDVFLEPGGRIVFNEVNTIPGFTAHSRFPNMMKAAGVSFEDVISRAIALAVEG